MDDRRCGLQSRDGLERFLIETYKAHSSYQAEKLNFYHILLLSRE